MGKSSSKLRQQQSGIDSTNVHHLLNEKDLRDWCQGFNKDFPDSQLTNILDNEQLLAPFLTSIFYREVEVSDCMQTLFRGNCLASKIMSHCFRTFGSKYLKQLLEPHLKPLTANTATNSNTNQQIKNERSASRVSMDSTSNIENTAQETTTTTNTTTTNKTRNLNNLIYSYEIDSTKLEANANIYDNQRNLLKLTEEILKSILTSASNFPPQLNSMCICLRQVLCKKYPNSDTSNLRAVGTVIFLRFINPAIVSPYESGIVDTQPQPKVLRGLMLVSKILQNIANNVEFSKEEHMLPFNDFVRAQFEPIRRWVSEISSERAE